MQGEDRDKRRHVPNSEIQTVCASGSHFELGAEAGRRLSGSISSILSELKISDSFGKSEHKLMMERIRANMKRICPELLEEVEGIAEGSAISFEQILKYNAIGEIWQAEKENVKKILRGKCTTIGFTDTKEGLAVAKTNDIGQDKEHYHVPHWFSLDSGRRMLIFTWPGTIWCNAGVNDAGLVCGGSSVGSDGFDIEGTPSNTVFRLLIERCDSTRDAVKFLREIRFMAHPFNLIIGDEKGDLVCVERDVGAMAVRKPERGSVFCSNIWYEKGMSERCRPTPESRQNSENRYNNLTRLSREAPHSIDRLKDILRDHSDPGAICQHGNAGMYTSFAYLVVPNERKLLFTYGPACRERFRIAKLDSPGVISYIE